jgi:hypothetical protein
MRKMKLFFIAIISLSLAQVVAAQTAGKISFVLGDRPFHSFDVFMMDIDTPSGETYPAG